MNRIAALADLPAVNHLREQVNRLHVEGRPDIFRPGFGEELQQHAAVFMQKEGCAILVSEREGKIVGLASVAAVRRPETPFTLAYAYLHIEEFCVDETVRRQGVGRELLAFVRQYARDQGLSRIELDVWAFNEEAEAFYLAEGFTTYRRYMETVVDP